MNDIDMLTAALERDPGNDILAAMLTDELIDARDMLHTEAAKHVATVQCVAVQAENLRLATWIYVSSKRAKRELHGVIQAMIDTGAQNKFDVMIIPGTAEPNGVWSRNPVGSRYWARLTVLVGADWLLECTWFKSR